MFQSGRVWKRRPVSLHVNTETSENDISGSDNAIGPPPPLNLSRPGDADDCWWQRQQWRQSDLCDCYKRWFAWNLLLHYNRQRTIADKWRAVHLLLNRAWMIVRWAKINTTCEVTCEPLALFFPFECIFSSGWADWEMEQDRQTKMLAHFDEHDSQAVFSRSFEASCSKVTPGKSSTLTFWSRGAFRCVLHHLLGAPSHFFCKYTAQSSIHAPLIQGVFL